MKTPTELLTSANLNIERFQFVSALPDFFTNPERIKTALSHIRAAHVDLMRLDVLKSGCYLPLELVMENASIAGNKEPAPEAVTVDNERARLLRL